VGGQHDRVLGRRLQRFLQLGRDVAGAIGRRDLAAVEREHGLIVDAQLGQADLDLAAVRRGIAGAQRDRQLEHAEHRTFRPIRCGLFFLVATTGREQQKTTEDDRKGLPHRATITAPALAVHPRHASVSSS
jgi:hypothetical protein